MASLILVLLVQLECSGRVRRQASGHIVVGAVTAKKDRAVGVNLEGSYRHSPYPWEQGATAAGLSVMDWQGDLNIGAHAQSSLLVRKTMLVARVNLNNRGAGQITVRASSNEQMQMALVGLIPMLRYLIGTKLMGRSEQM